MVALSSVLGKSFTLIAAFLCSAAFQKLFCLCAFFLLLEETRLNCFSKLPRASRHVTDYALGSAPPAGFLFLACVGFFFFLGVGGGEVLICGAVGRGRSSFRTDMEALLVEKEALHT